MTCKPQWFNPPFSVNESPAPTLHRPMRPVPLTNAFGVATIFAADEQTAKCLADALNLLHQLGYNAERNVVGSA